MFVHPAHRPRRTRFSALSALVGLLVLTAWGCGAPRTLTEPSGDFNRIGTPTSSLHYRSFGSPEELALYMRYSPEASPLVSAHRGSPTPGLAENSLEAFSHALNFAPALIEMDVRRTADGVLVLMHDETIDRTTTGSGRVDALSFDQVRRVWLEDVLARPTPFRVPAFAEALAWAEGRAILMVDVKADVPYAELVAAIRTAGAANRVVIIVYTLEDLLVVHALAPELAISVSAGTRSEVEDILASGVPAGQLIGFGGVGSVRSDVVAAFHAAGIRVQVGTFPLDDDARSDPAIYDRLLMSGVDVLATDNVPGASQAVQRESAKRRAARGRQN